MTVRLLSMIVAVSALLGCDGRQFGNSPMADTTNSPEVVYRLEGTQELLVFDLATSNYSVEGLEYLRERGSRSDIGGAFEICSDASFHCVSYPLIAVIPKAKVGQSEWEFRGRRCESESPLLQERTAIRCIFEGRSMRFRYSPEQGIEWFEQVGDRYSLVGSHGIFAETQ